MRRSGSCGETPEEHAQFVEKLAALANHSERAMVDISGSPAVLEGRNATSTTRTVCPIGASGRGSRTSLHPSMRMGGRRWRRAFSNYFHRTEGRGKNCVVEAFRRGELDYFFAYPEDYSQQSIEWVDGEFGRRPHNPAFEVIYVYSQTDGTLDLNFRGVELRPSNRCKRCLPRRF